MDLDFEGAAEPRAGFAWTLAALILGVAVTVGAVGAWTYRHQRNLLARRTLDTLATKACYQGRILSEWSHRCAEGLAALRRTPGLDAYLAGAGPFPGPAFQGAMRAGGFDAACLADDRGRPLPGTMRGDPTLAGEMGSPAGAAQAGDTPSYRLLARAGAVPVAVCWQAAPAPGAGREGRVFVRAACTREPFQSSSIRIWTYYDSETVALCQRGRGGVHLLRLAPQPFESTVEGADPEKSASLAVSGEILQGAEEGPDGRSRLYATFFEPATRWGILVRMDAADAFETLRPTFLLLGALELSLLLLVGAGLLLLARRRHLRLLSRANATLESLLGRLLTAQERERASIAADLHDGVAPILHAAETHAARAELGPGPEDLTNAAREARLRIGDAVRATRGLVAGLVPQALRKLGLAAALEGLAAGGPTTPQVRLHLTGGRAAAALPSEAREHLYRIAQEALQNARKHAGATAVTIGLESRGGALTLEVVDDGGGFDPGGPLAGHFGLGIMRQRARDIGATLRVETGPGGTRVTVRLPLPSRAGPGPGGRS